MTPDFEPEELKRLVHARPIPFREMTQGNVPLLRRLLPHLMKLWQAKIEHVMPVFTLEEIRAQYQDDPWALNYLTAIWDYTHQSVEVHGYPWRITLVTTGVCNARCHFCSTPSRPEFFIDIETMRGWTPILRYAAEIGIAGSGEPLTHPHFSEMLSLFRDEVDPRCAFSLVTNATLMHRHMDQVSDLFQTVNISLNAATARTHAHLMGLPNHSFDTVIAAARELIRRKGQGRLKAVNFSFVVTAENIGEIPLLIDLAEEMGIDWVYLRTLLPQNPLPGGFNYHLLPPTLNPDFERLRARARERIAATKIHVIGDPDSWGASTLTPEVERIIASANLPELSHRARKATWWAENKGILDPSRIHESGIRLSDSERADVNAALAAKHQIAEHQRELAGHDSAPEPSPYNRAPPYPCSFLYYNFQNDEGHNILPCCYKDNICDKYGKNVIYTGKEDFFEDIWNGSAMKALRASLLHGPITGACLTCPPIWE